MSDKAQSVNSRVFRFFEAFIYGGRWVIAPMYIGLLVSLLIYTYKFCEQIYELVLRMPHIAESDLLISVLSLVDITMIGNLIIMIMIGGYSIFVRKFRTTGDEEPPQWLEHITSGSLKIKMGMSLIGVSSIHLLKDFIDADKHDWNFIGKHVGIHVIFLTSTIALAYADKLMHSAAEQKATNIASCDNCNHHTHT